jgi:hypothetical protein
MGLEESVCAAGAIASGEFPVPYFLTRRMVMFLLPRRNL